MTTVPPPVATSGRTVRGTRAAWGRSRGKTAGCRNRFRGPSGPALHKPLGIAAPLRVGQSRIDATGQRADVVSKQPVGAVHRDRDGR